MIGILQCKYIMFLIFLYFLKLFVQIAHTKNIMTVIT